MGHVDRDRVAVEVRERRRRPRCRRRGAFLQFRRGPGRVFPEPTPRIPAE